MFIVFRFICLLFLHDDDQRHVAVLQDVNHLLLVEGDATAGIALGTLHVDKDGAAFGIDAFLVEVGGDTVVVLRLVGIHLLAATLVADFLDVDDLVVLL